jgi:hypothetical protein
MKDLKKMRKRRRMKKGTVKWNYRNSHHLNEETRSRSLIHP